VGILTRGWDCHGPGPIKVGVAELVGKHLKLIWRHALLVKENVVGCGTHGSLSRVLGDEVEVKSERRIFKLISY
jgi:hypothetical protein